jgi:HD-GYP domain-containing protein (c-di-GMP phosphodiesterase class II)
MQVCSLASVKRHIVLGAPLPFSVRGADKTLLLAFGQIVHDEVQLEELFDRGAVVEAHEVAAFARSLGESEARAPAPEDRIAKATVAQLPALWDSLADVVQQALLSDDAARKGALISASSQLMSLVDRSPDVAMSQIVRQHAAGAVHYGVSHSINAATACLVTARTLNWSVHEQRRAFNAGLTMNLSMAELQGRLAHQVSPLTANQRKMIQDHPMRSAALLEQAGIEDEDWLDAVRQHHELPDGTGYPEGRRDVTELSQLLRYADVYTALMSRRATRAAVSAREAGRELYQMAADSPCCQAVIKAFGVFPPGSFVRLASGELGVVTRNGDKAYHPQVAALTTSSGHPRRMPAARDTAQEEHAIVALVSEAAMPMRLTPEALAAAIAG